MKHAMLAWVVLGSIGFIGFLFANQKQAAEYARLNLRYEQVSADLAEHRDLLAEAETRSAQIDTIIATDTLIINRGIVQAQRLADSIGSLLPHLALAATAADSIPVLIAIIDARTLQTIEQTRTISLLLRDNGLLAADRAVWHELALNGDSVQAEVMDVLEGERAARGCFVVCIPNSLKTAGIATGAVLIWEKVIRPLVRIP